MKSPTPEDSARHRRKDILMAEDDEELRKLLADALRARGLTVTECQDGLALVETLVSRFEAGERPCDLVVSDVRMPGISGLSILEELAGWAELCSLPVVLITGFGEPRVHELAARFGAVSILEKPFEMATLMRVVEEAIDGSDHASARS